MFFNLFNILKRMMEAVRSEGHVIGSKVSAWELEQVKQLVTSGVYLNTSDFVRDAIRDKLAAIKTVLDMVGEDCISVTNPDKVEQIKGIGEALLEAMDDSYPSVRTAAVAGSSVLVDHLPSRFRSRMIFASVSDADLGVRQVATQVVAQDGGIWMG